MKLKPETKINLLAGVIILSAVVGLAVVGFRVVDRKMELLTATSAQVVTEPAPSAPQKQSRCPKPPPKTYWSNMELSCNLNRCVLCTSFECRSFIWEDCQR